MSEINQFEIWPKTKVKKWGNNNIMGAFLSYKDRILPLPLVPPKSFV